jgi:threonine dehydrogenase-like Zn-dependent dehydrogenase
MYQAGDVRVETVPEPVLREPTDAIVRVTSACICGSDLWPYQSMPHQDGGRRMGHEFIGIIEDLGTDVSGMQRGDLVVAPFVWADNTLRLLPGRLADLMPPRWRLGVARRGRRSR